MLTRLLMFPNNITPTVGRNSHILTQQNDKKNGIKMVSCVVRVSCTLHLCILKKLKTEMTNLVCDPI